MRRYTLSTLAVSAVAGAAAVALTAPAVHKTLDWHPATFNLDAAPARLLPANVSSEQPVRIVTTIVGPDGRPTVTTHTATTQAKAEALVAAGQHTPGALGVTVDTPAHVLDVPTGNDPYRASEWDVARTNVTAAWQRSTGAGTVVAVIDTGLDLTHPDLQGQTVGGWDLITGTAVSGNDDPNGHGTHVSGTIAAIAGNEIGVTGFAPDAKIMPVRVLDAQGSGWMSTVANGIYYAVANGAQVINMSLGSSGDDPTLASAVAYAHAQGVTVIAAAGNERGSGTTSYPAANPGVIAVAATDSNDNVASYSNQGSYVDVAAPGSGIWSTLPNATYGRYNGTSMASPHVAALAAMIKSADPSYTPDQIEQIIEGTAVDLGTPGRDDDFGNGRIDYAAALAAVTPPTTAPQTITPTTQTPTSDPTTQAPTTEPTTNAPTTNAPTSSAPTTDAPTTEPPTTEPTADPTPDPTPTLVTPSVRSSAPAVRTVNYGSSISGSFTVTAAGKSLAGVAAELCVAGATGTASCTARTTSPTGTVTWSQRVTAPIRVYLSVAATETSTAVTSPIASVKVQATVTVTRSGSKALVIGVGGVNGQHVQLQRLDGRKWVTAKTMTAASRLTATGLTKGRTYRVVVPSTSLYAGVTSATVTL